MVFFTLFFKCCRRMRRMMMMSRVAVIQQNEEGSDKLRKDGETYVMFRLVYDMLGSFTNALLLFSR